MFNLRKAALPQDLRERDWFTTSSRCCHNPARTIHAAPRREISRLIVCVAGFEIELDPSPINAALMFILGHRHLRFTSPESGRVQCKLECPLWARSGRAEVVLTSFALADPLRPGWAVHCEPIG